MKISTTGGFSVKALITGIVAVFIFSVLSSIIGFWLMNQFSGFNYATSSGQSVNEVFEQFLKDNFVKAAMLIVLSSVVQFFPPGLISGYFSKELFSKNNIIIWLVSITLFIASNISSGQLTISPFMLSIFVCNLLLATGFFFLGCSLTRRVRSSGDGLQNSPRR